MEAGVVHMRENIRLRPTTREPYAVYCPDCKLASQGARDYARDVACCPRCGQDLVTREEWESAQVVGFRDIQQILRRKKGTEDEGVGG